ncbi:MAG: NUDIX hydrolase [Minisyncoccia bacterium]|jgi:ADP-ribose pyrophosphatase
MENDNNHKPRPGLPPNARLVFKGVIFEVWQWEQKMFDGTTEIFEKIWRPPTVEVIATVGDKILIEEQDQPDRPHNINFPGGRADKGDAPLAEAKRELLEETGYESADWQLFMQHASDGKVIQDGHFFIARNCKKTKEPHLDPGEKIATKLVTFDELIALADEPRFWIFPEFIYYLLRLRLDPAKKQEFKALLFPYAH